MMHGYQMVFLFLCFPPTLASLACGDSWEGAGSAQVVDLKARVAVTISWASRTARGSTPIPPLSPVLWLS